MAKRQPLTFIQDPYPSFSSIAVDPVRNEVVMTDENRFRILVYDRTKETPASAVQSTPKRTITGVNTHTQYASDVYIDPPSGEIYVINNDTVHNTTIWGRKADGDAPPDREFVSPYGNFGAAVDESRQEMYLTLQHNSAIMVYKKSSGMKDTAVRLIQADLDRGTLVVGQHVNRRSGLFHDLQHVDHVSPASFRPRLTRSMTLSKLSLILRPFGMDRVARL